MKAKATPTPNSIALNVFLVTLLGGFGYMIWALSKGLPWYWKVGFEFGAFGFGILLILLSSAGFGAVPVHIVNPEDER